MDCNVPIWDDYFLQIAKTVAIRSKDPMTKVGAVLVSEDKRIIGTGYNGFAPGVVETPERWQRPVKYDFVVHAEANCLLHSVAGTKGGTLYTTLYPCKDCAKLIAAAGVKRIVFLDDKYWSKVAEEVFSEAGIIVAQRL